jgi:glycosyltransferase involved in cell wall biosynthesis
VCFSGLVCFPHLRIESTKKHEQKTKTTPKSLSPANSSMSSPSRGFGVQRPVDVRGSTPHRSLLDVSNELKTHVNSKTRDEETGKRPAVSVIIPTYNYAHFIGEAIESVLSQTYRNFEIIVVDDGSTDETSEVVAKFPEARYFNQPNQGIAAARNKGLQLSNGEALVFLDADDRLLPDALAIGKTFLEHQPDCVFVSGHWQWISRDGSLLTTPVVPAIDDNRYRAFLNFNYIGTVGQVMFRRSLFASEPAFDTTVPGCDDAELYMRIARKYPVGRHDHTVVEHRKHGANTSGQRAMMLRSMDKIYRRHLAEARDSPELEELCKQGIAFCKKFLAIELKRQRRERLKSTWLANSILKLRHRIRAAIIFSRYKRQRAREQNKPAANK